MTYSNETFSKRKFVTVMSIGREYVEKRAEIASSVYANVFDSDIKLSDKKKLHFAISLQYLIEHFVIHQRLKNFGSRRRSAKSKNTGKDHSDKVNAYLKRIKKANEIFERDALSSLDDYWQSKMVQLMNEVEQLTIRSAEAYRIVLAEKAHIRRNIGRIVSGLAFIEVENRNRILHSVLLQLKITIPVKVINQQLKRWSQKISEKQLTEADAKELIYHRKLLYFSVLRPLDEMKVLTKLSRDKDLLDFSI